ncbi:MAG TPA: hypothetical protein VEC99_09610 [Clostridia bacterium]|nr:hypothetical protein [Clostridia bacterium]
MIGLLSFGCSTPERIADQAPKLPPPPPQPYVRVSNSNSNLIQLQIAVRKFTPARRSGPVIWLAGVSHIGETNYYAALQKQLDAQTLVLFEGIGAAEGTDRSQETESASTANVAQSNRTETRASLQTSLAAALGLVFQLEAIDYNRVNFRNSDLSVSQLRDLLARQETPAGAPKAQTSFEGLLQMMEGGTWLDSLVHLGLRFLGANPKFQAMGRLAMIELLGQIQGDPANLGNLPPDLKQLLDVLLLRRNEKVMADLKSALRDLPTQGSVAVFYGTGHMPDMEQRLRAELNYSPAGEVWLTAFAVDLAKSGVTAPERDFISNLVQKQLKQMQ